MEPKEEGKKKQYRKRLLSAAFHQQGGSEGCSGVDEGTVFLPTDAWKKDDESRLRMDMDVSDTHLVVLYGAGLQCGICPLIPWTYLDIALSESSSSFPSPHANTAFLISPSLPFALLSLPGRRLATLAARSLVALGQAHSTHTSGKTLASIRPCAGCDYRHSSSHAEGLWYPSLVNVDIACSAALAQALFRRYYRPTAVATPLLCGREEAVGPAELYRLDGLEGLLWMPDVITVEEERQLMAALLSPVGMATWKASEGSTSAPGTDPLPLVDPTAIHWEKVNGRDVCHFGFRFKYGENTVYPTQGKGEGEGQNPSCCEPGVAPLPSIAQQLKERVTARLEHVTHCSHDPAAASSCSALLSHVAALNQCTINRYLSQLEDTGSAGSGGKVSGGSGSGSAGIPPHLDHPTNFGEAILTLSVGSDALMDFTPCTGTHGLCDEKGGTRKGFSVPLRRRGVGLMSGASRYQWVHSIPSRRCDHYFTGPEASSVTGCQCTSTLRSERLSITLREALAPKELTTCGSRGGKCK